MRPPWQGWTGWNLEMKSWGVAGEDLVPETVSRSSRSTPASRFVQADPFSHRPETEDQQVFIQYVVECSRLDVMRFWLKMLIDLRSPCVHYDLCGHLILYYLYVYVTISVVTLYYTISMCTWRFLWLPLTRILLTIAIESVSDAGCDGFSLLKLSKQKLSGDERTEKISTPQKRSRRICFFCNDLIISSAPMLKSLLITSNMSLYISVLKMWINFVLTKYKIS